MNVSIDPKPIGAFIEYTLKPLIDDSRELIDVLEKHDLKLGDVINYAFNLYIIDCIIRTISSITSVGIICWTAYHCLY